MNSKYSFTVFTPTYNMANTLHRVYESLQKQTFRDFEWIIVDDGSSDGTEQIVARWKSQAEFEIRYIYQANSGKHIARNKAVNYSRGELFATMDADDSFMPNALEVVYKAWQSIGDKEKYSGIACPCLDSLSGQIIGNPFPETVFDSNELETKYVLGLYGEKWGACRTSVLRQYPFPEIPGQKYFLLSYTWNQLANKYIHRYINIPLRVYHQDTPGSLTKIPRAFKFPLSRYEALNMEIKTAFRYLLGSKLLLFKKFIELGRFGIHSNLSVGYILKRLDSNLKKVLFGCFFPISVLHVIRDRKKGRVTVAK